MKFFLTLRLLLLVTVALTPCADCEIDPSALGDPHFTTWKGKKFDFHGECDLVLVSNPEFGHGLGMEIHARTEIRRSWSFITAVAIRIGEDILEVHGGVEENSYWMNGKFQGDLSTQRLGGFEVKYKNPPHSTQREYRIPLKNHNQEVTVKTFKDFVRVDYKNPAGKDLQSSVGIFGNFVTGALLARDGVTNIEDANEFGMEWQVQETEPKLFHDLVAPQHPEQCLMPSTTKRRRLGELLMNEEDARLACSDVDDAELQSCIYDVLSTGDVDMAQAC